MNRIKVLHYSEVWLGITLNWLYTIIVNLPENIESHIACERTENLDVFSIPNIHSFSEAPKWQRQWNDLLKRYRLRRYNGLMIDLVKKSDTEILHSHFGDAGVANQRVADKTGVKHVVNFYGYEIGRLTTRDPAWKALFRQMFRKVDRVVCEGPHMALRIAGLGCPEEKIFVNHIGVNVDDISFQPRKYTLGETPRFLIAASFREKKGITCALEALGKLKNETPVEITIIGDAAPGSSSDEEKRRILDTIEKLSLGPNVRLLGYQPYSVLMKEAHSHHIFVSPSLTASDGDTEGGAPITIIDMAASGMPVVSTRHCDIPEIIIHGKTGLLSEERDVNGIYENIKHLLASPESWGVLASSARKHIEENFSSRIQSAKLGELYRTLIR